jgi:hypothetical protein
MRECRLPSADCRSRPSSFYPGRWRRSIAWGGGLTSWERWRFRGEKAVAAGISAQANSSFPSSLSKPYVCALASSGCSSNTHASTAPPLGVSVPRMSRPTQRIPFRPLPSYSTMGFSSEAQSSELNSAGGGAPMVNRLDWTEATPWSRGGRSVRLLLAGRVCRSQLIAHRLVASMHQPTWRR